MHVTNDVSFRCECAVESLSFFSIDTRMIMNKALFLYYIKIYLICFNIEMLLIIYYI